jgi:hypothetical protein
VDAGKMADFLSRECTINDGTVVNRATGRIVRAALPVHLYGHPLTSTPCWTWPAAIRWPW